jgi:hypothetical protein
MREMVALYTPERAMTYSVASRSASRTSSSVVGLSNGAVFEAAAFEAATGAVGRRDGSAIWAMSSAGSMGP